jgi:uncharacterized oxidoreductase
MRLSDNTILITGGASGIGLALAKAFVMRDNDVIICGRNERKLNAARRDCPSIATFRCDIADAGDRERLAQHVADHHPGLNVLINNAGIQHNYDWSDARSHVQAIEEEVSINLLAQLMLTDLLLPTLLRRPEAAIINVTSALALVPKQSAPVYCATKAALRSFTRALRYQLEQTPVKVFEIIPALVDTDMTAGRGRRKISPARLAEESLRALRSDQHEIRIDKVKLLFALHRLLPGFAARILRRG